MEAFEDNKAGTLEYRISRFLDSAIEDNIVWCDEQVAEGVISLGWRTCNDEILNKELLRCYAYMIFAFFSEVYEVMTHFGDFKRSEFDN